MNAYIAPCMHGTPHVLSTSSMRVSLLIVSRACPMCCWYKAALSAKALFVDRRSLLSRLFCCTLPARTRGRSLPFPRPGLLNIYSIQTVESLGYIRYIYRFMLMLA